MTKYLYGRLTVETVEVEAKDAENGREQANELFKDKEANVTTYIFCWCEGGVLDTIVERNRALAAFLELMMKVIPQTPSQKGLIVLPDGVLPQQKIEIERRLPKPKVLPPPLPGDRPNPRVG